MKNAGRVTCLCYMLNLQKRPFPFHKIVTNKDFLVTKKGARILHLSPETDKIKMKISVRIQGR